MGDDTVMIEVPTRHLAAVKRCLQELLDAEQPGRRERRTGPSVVDDGPETSPVEPSGPGTSERRAGA